MTTARAAARVAAGAALCAAIGGLTPTAATAAGGASTTSTTTTSTTTTTTTTLPPGESGGLAGTQSQLSAAEAQAQLLAGQIEAQQAQLAQLSEQYDQASVALADAQSALAQTTAQLADDRQREAAARRQLQADAVNAYMYDVPAESLDALFRAGNETTALHQQYESTAIGDVSQAVDALQASERQLAATEAAQQAAAQEAAAQQSALQQSEQAAGAAAETAQVTLTEVRGHIGQLIVQQAAEQAAAEAAAAAAAATEDAKQQAAAAAAAAAQLAQTVSGGSQAADEAIVAADQAAAAAGTALSIGDGSTRTASGAGAVALHEAEKYLGVPYLWGGSSRSGVDCSGLTMLAWKAAGKALLHSAALQYLETMPVATTAVQPGDLLFYDLDGTGIDHVVMYVGSGPYGAATIIQAAHTGTVVSFDPDWTFGLVGAGRP